MVGPLSHVFISKANHNNAFHGIVNIEISFLFVNDIWKPNWFMKHFDMSIFSVRDFKNVNDNPYQLKKMYCDSVNTTMNVYDQLLL